MGLLDEEAPSGGLLGGAYNALSGLLGGPSILDQMRAIGAARANTGAPLQDFRADMSNPAFRSALSDMAGNFNMVGSIKGALPMDAASRMARAADQGYTVDAYKGAHPYTGGPVKNWKGEIIEAGPPEAPLTEFRSSGAPHAGFFSSDPETASRFARVLSRNGAVFPVKLKFDNPLVIDGKGKPAAAWQFESVAREHGMLDDYRAYKDAFASGHDGVIVKNTGDEGTVYIPREPQQVRSRFAAFDPAKKGSADILAGALPFGLLGLGLGDQ